MSKQISFTAKPSNRPTLADADKWVEQRTAPAASVEPMKMKRLTIDVPESLHRRLKTLCAIRGNKMADEIRALLEQHYQDET